MQKIREYVQNGEVDEAVVQDVLQKLYSPHRRHRQRFSGEHQARPLVNYTQDRHTHRIEIITDDAEIPGVDDLVKLNENSSAAAD